MSHKRYRHVAFSLLVGGLLLVGLLLFLDRRPAPAQAAPTATNRYVSPTGWDSRWEGLIIINNDCTDPTDPCRTVQWAILWSNEGDIIQVATGVYTAASSADAVVAVDKSITLYGGWDDSFTTRDPEQYPTVLDGERQRRVVYIGEDITVTLDGFVITRGDATGHGFDDGCPGGTLGGASGCGGGIYAKNACPILVNNVITDNVATTDDTSGAGYGGGVGIWWADGAVISGNLIISNTAGPGEVRGAGGGLLVMHSEEINVRGNRVLSNTATRGGGGLFLRSGSGTVEQNVLRFNESDPYYSRGAGIEVYFGSYAIRENQVTNNQGNSAVWLMSLSSAFESNEVIGNGTSCGILLECFFEPGDSLVVNNVVAGGEDGICGSGSADCILTAHLIHNTLVGNGSGIGVQAGYSATLYLTNTIVASYTTGITVSAGVQSQGQVIADHTLFWANGDDGIRGTNPVSGDPRFVDPAGGDYHIRAGSAAIGRGVDAGVTTDFDGEGRVGAPDLGADEYVMYTYLPLTVRNY